MTKPKTIPDFKTEAEERAFWETHDGVEYFDLSQAKKAVFPNLKPTTEKISIRLPKSLLYQLKLIANKKDVPYQSLMKEYLDRSVKAERKR